MTFTSRPQVDAYIERVNAAFDNAETVAGDRKDSASTDVARQSACGGDVRPHYARTPAADHRRHEFRLPETALWIANRLYGDAGRNKN